MNDDGAIAHVRQRPDGAWESHDLGAHGEGVARLAERFASFSGSGDWARLAGLWHDLGKYRPQFQRYIARASGYDPEAHLEGDASRPDHSTAGALHAVEKLGIRGRLLAYLIAGHHAGLPDWNSPEEGLSSLFQRLEAGKRNGYLPEALGGLPPRELLDRPAPAGVPPAGCSLALWIRMLFSCLVDADFLDTEAFMDGDKAARRGGYPDVRELLARFDRHMAGKGGDSPVNRIRADVLRQCREKSAQPPGLFSLTVPTGGGKTLSSMAFALNHAARHGKGRVVVFEPPTDAAPGFTAV